MESDETLEHKVSLLTRRCSQLGLAVLAIAGMWLVSLFAFLPIHLRQHVQADQPDVLRVRGLVVVDEKGVERVRIGAPVPNPVIKGKQYPRKAPVSGMILYDPEGNERGGLSTTDTKPSEVFLGLDTEAYQAVTLIANPDGGANLSLSDDNGSGINVTVVKEPFIRIVRHGKVIFLQGRPPKGL